MGSRASVVQQCVTLSGVGGAGHVAGAEHVGVLASLAASSRAVSLSSTGSDSAADAPAPLSENECEVRVVQCSEGGALTRWADGASCVYVNAGRYRNGPSIRYRNRFWTEGESGVVRMSWFPGRGHSVTSAAVERLVSPPNPRTDQAEAPLLLFCRRAPSQPYFLCGRLRPVAIAQPVSTASETGANTDSGDATVANGQRASVRPVAPLPVWQTTQAAHVVFELLDAAELLSRRPDALATVLGGREVESRRPAHYCDGAEAGGGL
jgi:hypothetical protein